MQKCFPVQSLLSSGSQEPNLTSFDQMKKVFDLIFDKPIGKVDLQQRLFKIVLESNISLDKMQELNSQLLDNLSHFASQSMGKLSKRHRY